MSPNKMNAFAVQAAAMSLGYGINPHTVIIDEIPGTETVRNPSHWRDDPPEDTRVTPYTLTLTCGERDSVFDRPPPSPRDDSYVPPKYLRDPKLRKRNRAKNKAARKSRRRNRRK